MPVPHRFEQPHDEHRIQVVHGFRPAGEALFLRVTRQSQDVFHAHARQSVQTAFKRGAVSVLAGEVRNRRQALLLDGRDKGLRWQRGIAARQVRHTDHLDAVRLDGGFVDERLGFFHIVVPA